MKRRECGAANERNRRGQPASPSFFQVAAVCDAHFRGVVWAEDPPAAEAGVEFAKRRLQATPAVAEAREDEHLCFAACGTKQQRLLPAVLI